MSASAPVNAIGLHVTDEELSSDPALADVIHRAKPRKSDMSTIFSMVANHSATWFADGDMQENHRARLAALQVVTRKEEDAFLRTRVAATGERDCANGKDCEGTKLIGPPQPVTLVEHWLQSLPSRPEKAQLCILCKRAAINYFYVNAMCEGDSMQRLFHNHANLVEQEGEYALEQCVISGARETHGVLLPCALHCRARYAYSGTRDGVHWFTQAGYVYPQVFRRLAGDPCLT